MFKISLRFCRNKSVPNNQPDGVRKWHDCTTINNCHPLRAVRPVGLWMVQAEQPVVFVGLK